MGRVGIVPGTRQHFSLLTKNSVDEDDHLSTTPPSLYTINSLVRRYKDAGVLGLGLLYYTSLSIHYKLVGS